MTNRITALSTGWRITAATGAVSARGGAGVAYGIGGTGFVRAAAAGIRRQG